MAETNKSQLMSEAEIIEAINADSLISVSLGAGQPQKNVKMSTLASVAAGLWPFLNIYRSPFSYDADSIKYNMVYLNMSVLSNVPYSYGTLICFGNETHTVQIYVPASKSEGGFYYRQCTDATWSPWVKL